MLAFSLMPQQILGLQEMFKRPSWLISSHTLISLCIIREMLRDAFQSVLGTDRYGN